MKKKIIAVIGLGYVGLQVAKSFSKKKITYGFDIDKKRIHDLKKGIDRTKEVRKKDLIHKNLFFSNDLQDLLSANFFIITVPTPVDKNNKPNLKFILQATKTIAKIIKKGDIIVYESTVYPGVTEDICIPLIEKNSGLRCQKDFNVGYSPERINPGDKKNKFEEINKIVSAQNNKTLREIYLEYTSVIKAKIYMAKSIKIAEAAKVIENTQRDLNIALINELSIIFNLMNLNTLDVLEAASTKWNFLNFKPGLVGGHCIGVDPYYLTYKSKKLGYEPKVILSGRKTNDEMSFYIVNKICKELSLKKNKEKKFKVNILGVSFKENCTDLRNSKVFDLIKKFRKQNYIVEIVDPVVNSHEISKKFNISLKKINNLQKADVTIIAVAHRKFVNLKLKDFKSFTKKNGIIFDIKGILHKNKNKFEKYFRYRSL